MKYLITGGAGFIGSALIRHLINETESMVLNYDKLTYSGNLYALTSVSKSKRYKFIKGDINDKGILSEILEDYKPNFIMNLAAETHVDNSIINPKKFIDTNICGTYNLLVCAQQYWNNLSTNNKEVFRFHHISTDEVFGSLSSEGLFNENSPYNPSSPYSASKASSDHIVRAWYKTYDLPVLLTNCSNNYGPYQYPEKLIPLMIKNAIAKKKLPVYGTGNNIRDWLYVDDHVRALNLVVNKGNIGETYNIGGNSEKTNLEVVHSICNIIREFNLLTKKEEYNYSGLINLVEDRPGHDFRYAIDSSKIRNQLNWRPLQTFETGLRKTVDWYLKNIDFLEQS